MGKRRPYLVPFALAFAALLQSEPSLAKVTDQVSLPGGDERSSLAANPRPFDFVIEKSDASRIVAAHGSHRSHSSHRSHRSHYSGR